MQEHILQILVSGKFDMHIETERLVLPGWEVPQIDALSNLMRILDLRWGDERTRKVRNLLPRVVLPIGVEDGVVELQF